MAQDYRKELMREARSHVDDRLPLEECKQRVHDFVDRMASMGADLSLCALTHSMTTKANSHAGIAGIATGLVILVIMTVIVNNIIANLTASGQITGLGVTISQFVVPMMWVGGLVTAAKLAGR